jgi:hypothetical protein
MYLERVDPLTKIIHAPSFWTSIQKVASDPLNASKSLQALAFTFYFVTISSLDARECERLLGVESLAMHETYKRAAQQSLIQARFLESSNFTTLQAYMMFLVSMS